MTTITTSPKQAADLRQISMLIGGEWKGSQSGEWIDSVNPANEDVIGRFPAGNAQDVSAAVAAATASQPAWAAKTWNERAELLRAVAKRFLERANEIVELEVMDTGNTIGKLISDVHSAAAQLDLFAGLALEIKGETIPATNGNLHFTVREPYGVVGRIVPFNHPFLFAASRIAAPLAAGNAVVVKPPEQSSLTSGFLGEVCSEILPPGVVNIVTGLGRTVGDALVRHPGIRRIAFIGSVPTGIAIQRAAAEVGVKHVSLELGGKNPMIVFPDADPAEVADAAVRGMNFAWAGQSCGSTSRLMLHRDLHDEVLERVAARVRSVKIGDPMDRKSEMGPVNSKGQLDKVTSYIEAGKKDGARLVAGGGRPKGEEFERGYWVEPTLFADVTPQMRIAREEIFGPVLSVMKWSNLDEALATANSTEYGLTAAIWTHDLNQALKTASRVQSGYVWINGCSNHFLGTPFGGYKNSGLGKEESVGELLSYTQAKTIHVMLR